MLKTDLYSAIKYEDSEALVYGFFIIMMCRVYIYKVNFIYFFFVSRAV